MDSFSVYHTVDKQQWVFCSLSEEADQPIWVSDDPMEILLIDDGSGELATTTVDMIEVKIGQGALYKWNCDEEESSNIQKSDRPKFLVDKKTRQLERHIIGKHATTCGLVYMKRLQDTRSTPDNHADFLGVSIQEIGTNMPAGTRVVPHISLMVDRNLQALKDYFIHGQGHFKKHPLQLQNAAKRQLYDLYNGMMPWPVCKSTMNGTRRLRHSAITPGFRYGAFHVGLLKFPSDFDQRIDDLTELSGTICTRSGARQAFLLHCHIYLDDCDRMRETWNQGSLEEFLDVPVISIGEMILGFDSWLRDHEECQLAFYIHITRWIVANRKRLFGSKAIDDWMTISEAKQIRNAIQSLDSRVTTTTMFPLLPPQLPGSMMMRRDTTWNGLNRTPKSFLPLNFPNIALCGYPRIEKMKTAVDHSGKFSIMIPEKFSYEYSGLKGKKFPTGSKVRINSTARSEHPTTPIFVGGNRASIGTVFRDVPHDLEGFAPGQLSPSRPWPGCYTIGNSQVQQYFSDTDTQYWHWVHFEPWTTGYANTVSDGPSDQDSDYSRYKTDSDESVGSCSEESTT